MSATARSRSFRPRRGPRRRSCPWPASASLRALRDDLPRLVRRRRQPRLVLLELQRRLLRGQPRIFDLPGDRLLPLLQRRRNRPPGKLVEHRQQDQEHDERVDRQVEPQLAGLVRPPSRCRGPGPCRRDARRDRLPRRERRMRILRGAAAARGCPLARCLLARVFVLLSRRSGAAASSTPATSADKTDQWKQR